MTTTTRPDRFLQLTEPARPWPRRVPAPMSEAILACLIDKAVASSGSGKGGDNSGPGGGDDDEGDGRDGDTDTSKGGHAVRGDDSDSELSSRSHDQSS